MKRTTSIATLAIAGSLLAAGCGAGDDEAVAGNATDRAFVEQMVPHHESAVEMAKIALERGGSPFVKELAADVVRTQDAEISTMEEEDAELADQRIDVGELGLPMEAMGMEGSVESLKTAEPFDRAFIEMMLPHHTGAIEMARIELQRGEDPELRALAEAVIATQQREIRGMRDNL